MTILHALVLFVAALAAGALNSVAGGGSFISFPALMFTGVPAIGANATNTAALWPGTLASASAYRAELKAQRRLLILLGSPSLAGGLLGALLLLRTPEPLFVHLVLFLLLLATLLFAFSGTITGQLRKRLRRPSGSRWTSTFGVVLLQLVIATYGGFFGGGIGILMLATLAVMGMENIHAMNGLKTVLASLINGVAVVAFVLAGAVLWPQAILMIVGSVIGGYGGAYTARRLDPRQVRRFVIAVGCLMTIYFFIRR
jgi:uncharacterized protein